MLALDYVGLATLVAALFTGLTGMVVALRQNPIARKVDDVHAQVTTSNGESLASIVEGNDLRTLDPDDPPPKP